MPATPAQSACFIATIVGALLPSIGHGDSTTADDLAAQDSAASPIEVRNSSDQFVVDSDGLFVETIHEEVQANNDAAARQIGQKSIAYSSSMFELDVLEAYTLKSDGRKVPVDPATIRTQASPAASSSNLYSDIVQTVILFPDVGNRDVVVYTARRRAKASYFPGQFMAEDTYPRTLALDNVQVRITVPSTLPLKLAASGVDVHRDTSGKNVVYDLRYSAPDALAAERTALSSYDRGARYFASTFPDYETFSHSYATLIDGKADPSPKLRALATSITSGTTDRRQQAEKLYAWVSGRVRYVAVELGKGNIIPHAAQDVADNGYGDCKDHAVLYSALLNAVGIQSELVLINLGTSYSLPDVPAFGPLNHAITWLPEFGLYADTTAGVAPFGTLPFQEYGKPVVHVVHKGVVRRRTPLVPQEDAGVFVRTDTTMTADGHFTGTTRTEATGAFSVLLRQAGVKAEAVGTTRAALGLLARSGGTGTASMEMPSPYELGSTFAITAHYDLTPRQNVVGGAPFLMPGGLRVVGPTGDMLMGPLFGPTAGDLEATPCFSGKSSEVLSLQLPPGKHLAHMPEDQNINTTNLSFSAKWSVSERTVSVRRDFTSHINTSVCDGAVREATAAALKRIAAGYLVPISLADDGSVSMLRH